MCEEMLSERDRFFLLADTAEKAENFKDMRVFLKKIADLDPIFTTQQRDFFMEAYKNVTSGCRLSWRAVRLLEEEATDEKKRRVITNYRQKVQDEVQEICDEVLSLLNDKIIPCYPNPEDVVCEEDGTIALSLKVSLENKDALVLERSLYYKMRADYSRYKAEVSLDEKRAQLAQEAEDAYQEAMEVSKKLDRSNPAVLALSLTMSVFYYQIRNDLQKACRIAKEAYDFAVEEMDAISDERYSEAKKLLESIQQNIRLWSAELAGEIEPHQEKTMALEGAPSTPVLEAPSTPLLTRDERSMSLEPHRRVDSIDEVVDMSLEPRTDSTLDEELLETGRPRVSTLNEELSTPPALEPPSSPTLEPRAEEPTTPTAQ